MNLDKARHLMTILQAELERRTVQTRNEGGDWFDCAFHVEGEWRVKPEPREFWLVYDGEHRDAIYEDSVNARAHGEVNGIKPIHVREVIE